VLGAGATCTLLASRPVPADQSLQAIATLTTGYTDNVELVPDNPEDPTVTPAVTSDAFANIAPGLVFAHEGHRITQVLRYVLSIRLYAEASSANSFSNTLGYGAVIPLTPRAGLTADVTASHGRLNAFDLAPQDTQVQGQGQGDQAFATGGVGLGYTYQLTPSWQYGHTAGASIYEPLDDTVQIGRRTTVDSAITLAKSFNFNSFTFAGRGSYTIIEAGDDIDGAQQEDVETVLLGPELRWVHDLSLDFSTDAMIGATITFPPGEFQDREVFPVGAATLRYQHDRYAGSIGYRRAVATNLQLGETEATHVGEARGVIPLPFGDRLSLAGAAGYAYGESVGRLDPVTMEEVTLTTKQWVGDLSLAWQIADGLSSSLRYQYVRQNRNDPTRRDMDGELLNEEERTRRQQITVVLEGTYPSRQAVELPRDSSTRVDGGLESMSQREDSLVR
jgi:hypothetical protein